MNKQDSSRGVSEDVNSTAETTVVKTKTEVITIKVENKPEFINYPLWAKQIEPTSSKFQVHLHGVIVLRSKDDSSLRLRLLKTLLGGLSDDKDDEDDEVEKKQLQERLSWFFGKNVHGRHIEKVVLKLPGGDLEFIQPENVVTDPYGHYAIDFETELPGAKLGSSYQYEVVLAAGSDPQTEPGAFGIGRFQLLGFHGYSIVSDVDDTVKDTRVLEFKEMLRRAFLLSYKHIPEMNSLYSSLANRISKETGQDFGTHFLSASPYAILPPLDLFFNAASFPPCMVQVANFTFWDLKSLKPDLRQYKAEGIKHIAKEFPGRKLILFGDSGQLDPEAFALVVRETQEASNDPQKWPEQFVGIFIREVSGNIPKLTLLNTALRFQRAFYGLDARKWRVFSDPKEIETLDLVNGEVWRPNEVNKYADPVIENLKEQIELDSEGYSTKATRAFSSIKSIFGGSDEKVVAEVQQVTVTEVIPTEKKDDQTQKIATTKVISTVEIAKKNQTDVKQADNLAENEQGVTVEKVKEAQVLTEKK